MSHLVPNHAARAPRMPRSRWLRVARAATPDVRYGQLLSRRRRRPGVGFGLWSPCKARLPRECFRAGAAVPASASAYGRRAKPGSQENAFAPAPPSRRRLRLAVAVQSPAPKRMPSAHSMFAALAIPPPLRHRWLRLQTTPAPRHGQPLTDPPTPRAFSTIKAPRDSEGTAGHWAHPLKNPPVRPPTSRAPFGTRLIFRRA